MSKLRVLDLFSGIGGFSLGLERTGGFETVAFCEIEKFPQKVLAKHWPEVPIYEDVRSIHGVSNTNAARMEESRVDKAAQGNGKERRDYERGSRGDGGWVTGTCADGENRTVGSIDIITGGFPCQDISVAGNQKGIGEGTRSGLWSECARLLGEIRPDYAIFENVTALLSGDSGRWFQRVLFDISEVGYDAEWHCIPASELGAHHHRDRVWIICYPQHNGSSSTKIRGGAIETSNDNAQGQNEALQSSGASRPKNNGDVADSRCEGFQQRRSSPNACKKSELAGGIFRDGLSKEQEPERKILADTNSQGLQGLFAGRTLQEWSEATRPGGQGGESLGGTWAVEPDICRVANGIPDRTHRLKGLGNAVVPQIPELIGRAILEAENEMA